MITLSAPTRDVQLALALAAFRATTPERVGLQALALCLSWPAPPWEADALAQLQLAQQEEREARQWVGLAEPEKRAAARQAHLNARIALQQAEEAHAELRFSLADPIADGRLAIARLDAAGVPASAWLLPGSQLLSAWMEALGGVPEAQVQETLTFSLPPQDRTSGGGSISPVISEATPSSGSP